MSDTMYGYPVHLVIEINGVEHRLDNFLVRDKYNDTGSNVDLKRIIDFIGEQNRPCPECHTRPGDVRR